MVMGFPEDGWDALYTSVRYSLRQAWRGAVIRPYLAKVHVPGSGGWEEGGATVETYLSNPDLLLHADFAMVGSQETHPDPRQRLMVNAAYLTLIGLLTPFGLCPTRPLLPMQNARGLVRRLGEAVNRLMPFDR